MKKIILVLLLTVTTIAFAQREPSKDYNYEVSTPYKVVDAKKNSILVTDPKY